MKRFIKKLWGPEDLTYKIYSGFTLVRKPTFYILFIFVLVTAITSCQKFPLVNQESFSEILKVMVNALLAVGAITVAFVTISIEIIRRQEKSKDIIRIWSNLAKYIIYPFVVATIIGIILFLKEDIVDFSKVHFSLLVLFGYLTVNSFFGIIKAAENLINEEWRVAGKKTIT